MLIDKESLLWLAVLVVVLALGGVVFALLSPALRPPVMSAEAPKEQLEKWRKDAEKFLKLRKKVGLH